MSRRFQFSLRALLVATFGIACFFGGVSWQRSLDKPLLWHSRYFGFGDTGISRQTMVLANGEVWEAESKTKTTVWNRTGQLTPEELAYAKAEAEADAKAKADAKAQ